MEEPETKMGAKPKLMAEPRIEQRTDLGKVLSEAPQRF